MYEIYDTEYEWSARARIQGGEWIERGIGCEMLEAEDEDYVRKVALNDLSGLARRYGINNVDYELAFQAGDWEDCYYFENMSDLYKRFY